MKIYLSKLKWHNYEKIWVTGFIRIGNRYLENTELLNHFSDIETITDFEKVLKTATGQFSIIIRSSTEIWAATDGIRNYPLFYTYENGDFVLSDDCYNLTNILGEKSFNQRAVDSFLASGYAINNLTLIKNIYQIEAGEYIKVGDSFSKKFYCNISNTPVVEKDFKASANELKDLFEDVFKNHFQAMKDRFIAISLSGGFDSRLIAIMCSKYHPENVLCYTYGIRDNLEVAPAKEVAARLGFKWVNIVYDGDLTDNFLTDNYFNDYYPYASGLSSMFYMQDYFAVKYLKEKKLVPDNCVFIPGFSGDMLAGGHLTPKMCKKLGKNILAKEIFKEFFSLVNLNKEKQLKLIKLIEDKIPSGELESWKVFESWDQKERQSKFIVNSARVFSFFGYNYVLPLFDNALIDFFSGLPFQFKLDKRLYDYVLTEIIFREFCLNLPKELNPLSSQKAFQRLKERIKPFIPSIILNFFVKQKCPVFYDEITKKMLEEIDPGQIIKPRQSNYYNSYITQWYLIKTKESLRIR
jgi:asparagine synthase (glutamine-hydrolysing)